MDVSICMITYNHEKFIAQAIESIIFQKTDYIFELVIGDDYSTDKTREICKLYKRKYPDLIHLILNEKNLGIGKNFYQTLSACKGKYIAICEGDDFWHNKDKLQLQLKFMEENPDYIFSTTDFRVVINEDYGNITCPRNDFLSGSYDFKEMLKGNLTATNTIIFRNLKPFPADFIYCNVADWPLKLYLLQYGDAFHITEFYSTYRVHNGGIWNGSELKKRDEMTLSSIRKVVGSFEDGYKRDMLKLYRKILYVYCVNHKSKERLKTIKHLLSLIGSIPLSNINIKALYRLIIFPFS